MPALTYIEISGSPHEAGEALGRFGAQAVSTTLVGSIAWANVMQWRGSRQAAAMASHVRGAFPRVWAELEGLAAGLKLPFEDVFLWNARGDVWPMAPDGCTTVQLPGTQTRRFAHNEDGFPGFGGQCAIAECAIEGSPRFASFVYPGSLPGHTFAVTDNGIAITVNNLRLLQVDAGVPRMVLTRALLDASTVENVLDLIRTTIRAGGYHLTLAQQGRKDMLSVEFGGGFCSARVVDANSVHANHAIHAELRDVPQIVTGSSGNRQTRGEKLISHDEGAAIDPLSILSDCGNATFPIYRDSSTDSDDENTMATADITVCADAINWHIHEHPGHAPRFIMKNGRRSPKEAKQEV